MKKTDYKAAKYACYTTNISMAAVAALPPLLFLTFREAYGISFSMLGALVLINFCTQLLVDVLLSFYACKINLYKTIKVMPALTAIGLFIYAVLPFVFPNAVYVGLSIGTVIFSASGGLAEVLISPVIAAIPSENPDAEMSKLHSAYAWGVVVVVVISTLLLRLLGSMRWQIITLLWAIVPIISLVLFLKAPLPELKTPEKASNVLNLLKNKQFLVCFFLIFLGGASECTMSQWSSGYLEQSFNIPKVFGDIFGVALFAVMLGLGRSLYAKIGKKIKRVLLLGALGATICYIVATFSSIPILGLLACAMTGFATSMLWPGSLIVGSDKFPKEGVVVFALMAAGGDFGASVGPQLVGSLTDFALANQGAIHFASSIGITAEQLAMKIGLASATLFPLILSVLIITNYKKLS